VESRARSGWLFPRISIVTPSFNQRRFIERALESVRDQSYPSVEHLVFDGGSTDGTVEYLQSLSGKSEWGHLRWTSEADRGQSDAINKGFRMATGDIVGWLNSDDLYRSGCFAGVAKAYVNYTADILYGDTTWVDENNDLLQIRREISFNRFVMLYHRVLCVPTAATFFKRCIFDAGNFVDLQYKYSMDLEFFLRLASLGYRFKHVPALWADFRWHQDSKSSVYSSLQFEERDRILPLYSPLFRALRPVALNRMALGIVRFAAAFRYWGEKLVRGYYFERSRTSTDLGPS
jgi:glycosyltransferase involved in cell wall biosynthesis